MVSITFVPFQSRSMLLQHMCSSINSFGWKLAGKDFEGYSLQSRNTKSSGRCLGSWLRQIFPIMRNFKQGIFEKDSGSQCASFGLGNFKTMP